MFEFDLKLATKEPLCPCTLIFSEGKPGFKMSNLTSYLIAPPGGKPPVYGC